MYQTTNLTQETEFINGVNTIVLSPEARKELLITELYKTGCVGGVRFNNTKANPIRSYIAGCLYKQRLANSPELIDDCYNECFAHLQMMPAAKVCAMYDEAPAKLVATALRIIALKCFAVDPRYNNPRHSLIQHLSHTSSMQGGYNIDPCDTYSAEGDYDHTASPFVKDNRRLLSVTDNEPDEFEIKYGFSVECLVEHLTTEERVTFYEMIDKQPRGKVSREKIERRILLIQRIKDIKHNICL